MSRKILVTYASRAGSTAEVAEAIGKTLIDKGVQVDVMSMNNVKDISSYQAVVAGSAIHKSRWLPEAVEFIKVHQAELSQKTFAIFTVCITLGMLNGFVDRSSVKKWVAPVRALVKPMVEGYFAGRLDFSNLPLNMDTLLLRIMVALGFFPRGDHRNWDAIHIWARSLKSVLAK
jgi:menaquinone-dependent protoporphyrinogen oxidase